MPDVSDRNWFFFGAGLGFPVFIVILAWLDWEANLKKIQRLLSVSPFNELKSIGFFEALKYKESKWDFTEIVLVAEIGGYSIICQTDREKKHSFSMAIFLMPRQIDGREMAALKRKFKEHNIDYDNFVARKWYNTRKPQVASIEELKKDVEEFIQLLKEAGCENR